MGMMLRVIFLKKGGRPNFLHDVQAQIDVLREGMAKLDLAMTRSSHGSHETTSAERGEPSIRLISPKHSPAPSRVRMTSRPSTSRLSTFRAAAHENVEGIGLVTDPHQGRIARNLRTPGHACDLIDLVLRQPCEERNRPQQEKRRSAPDGQLFHAHSFLRE